MINKKKKRLVGNQLGARFIILKNNPNINIMIRLINCLDTNNVYSIIYYWEVNSDDEQDLMGLLE